MEQNYTKVGIGVMIWKDGKVLMGKRKSKNGFGTYAWPGGHLEYMEGFEECARRETREECGLEIKNVRFLRLLNLQDKNNHYTDIGMIADWESGEPQLLEPEKCEGWSWYDPENLPSPVFSTILSYFESLKSGKNFFDK